MHGPANDDRRKNNRQPGQHGYLEICGHQAVLVDWSFGGLGVRFGCPVELVVAQEVDIFIFDPGPDHWEALPGIVRRIDADGIVGIEFKDTDQRVIGILLRLLGNRLTGVTI